MKIDFEMNYQEFIWVCKTVLRCEDFGYEIEKISRDPKNNEVSIKLESIVLGEENFL